LGLRIQGLLQRWIRAYKPSSGLGAHGFNGGIQNAGLGWAASLTSVPPHTKGTLVRHTAFTSQGQALGQRYILGFCGKADT
jgi:hypothetical protein